VPAQQWQGHHSNDSKEDNALHCAMHNVALTAIAMIDAVTSSAIAITIAMMYAGQGIILALNVPLATGKTNIATISQKKQATRNIGATARYRTPSTPSQTNQ
jgi:hypothetical protein